MSLEEINILKRALERERASRKAAEEILEAKSRELYQTSQKLEKLLLEKSSELQGVFENIVDAYVIMDINGNILKFNDAAVDMFGYDIEKESLNVQELIFKEDTEYAMSSFNKLLSNGFFKDYEARIYTKDKEVKWVHINASIVTDEYNTPIAAQGIVRDITEIKNLELQKEKLLTKLEKSNEELQEYAHIVSHDLKSPLRSIDALVSWIKEDNQDNLDEASRQNLELIQSTLEKMEQLISDVLNYSSVATENSNEEKVDVQRLVENVLELIYIPNHIKISLLKPLPVVNGDATKLQQVFQNIISNAIKFNDKSEGFVEIDVEDESTHYKFSIKDNGIGIASQFHDKVFKIFHALNKSKESSGIGLSIVKKIVNLHGGNVWLESTPNLGTTFYFTLKK